MLHLSQESTQKLWRGPAQKKGNRKCPIKVRPNKVALKRPISAVVLPPRVHFWDHTERKQSNRGSNYLELLFLLSEHNNDLYYSLSNIKARPGRWVKIHNEIIIAAANIEGEGSRDEAMEVQFAVLRVHRSMDTSNFAESRADWDAAVYKRQICCQSLSSSQTEGGQKMSQPWSLHFWKSIIVWRELQ